MPYSPHAPALQPRWDREGVIADSAGSIFDNLAGLRCDHEAAGIRETLCCVYVREPRRTEFVRAHPAEAMQVITCIFTDRDEGEVFIVAPAARDDMSGELRLVRLVAAVSTRGETFLWPVALRDGGWPWDFWAQTAEEAYELAKTAWVRMTPDWGLGAYRIHRAEGQLSEPVWPDKPLPELLKLAFKGRVIDSADHPVIKRLRGLL